MKNFFRVVMIVSMVIGAQLYGGEQDELSVEVAAKKYARLPIMLGLIGISSSDELVKTIKKDLEFTEQFLITVRDFNPLQQLGEVKNLSAEGFSLAIFLSGDAKRGFEWRVYDTGIASMAQGKKYAPQGALSRGWAHNLADAFWPVLTGQEGMFSTKLAYCKEVKSTNKKVHHKLKHIWIADYDGSNAQPLITTPTINVAPRWNRDSGHPLLFYSENRRSNIPLIVATLDGKRSMASNLDGVTLAPAFSADGKKVIYCASRGSGYCQLYLHENGEYKQLTHNAGNALCPALSDDGTMLYYVSDFPTGVPHIYSKNLVTGAQTRLTGGEPAFCPSYNGKKKKLAYTKSANGIMQVFLYDERTGTHKQLTSDAWDKDECSWSPCGNYLVVGAEKAGKERLALINIFDGKLRFITSEKEVCSYPAWSGIYNQYPSVTA